MMSMLVKPMTYEELLAKDPQIDKVAQIPILSAYIFIIFSINNMIHGDVFSYLFLVDIRYYAPPVKYTHSARYTFRVKKHLVPLRDLQVHLHEGVFICFHRVCLRSLFEGDVIMEKIDYMVIEPLFNINTFFYISNYSNIMINHWVFSFL